jgi:hypothetical protein
MGGRVDLVADLLVTRARSTVRVRGGTYVANPRTATAGEPGVFHIPAESLPAVTTDVVGISIAADYRLSRQSTVRLKYAFEQLRPSDDFGYQGLQWGSVAAFMPTNEQVARYSVHFVGASYVYEFR